jgi:transposase-like protein
MATHFLQTKAARTLSLAEVFRMSEGEAETAFRKIRWSQTEGAPVCPSCGGLDAYSARRPSGLLRFRCKACAKDVTITSGTLFAAHKAPLRAYLAAIAVFMNEVKGKNALALSRDLGMSHKACWVMLHKMREAMAEEFRGRKIGGSGKVAEIDGAYFGGYVRPANFKRDRIDRRLLENRTGKRQSVIIVRERNGNSLPAVFRSEGAALAWIKSRVQPGTIVNADEASGWNDLSSKYEMKRINHQEAYSNAR